MTQTSIQPETTEFSLVQGGPLFQLWRRARLSGPALEFGNRRTVVFCLFLWLPLLLLSVYEGHAFGSRIKIPFLADITIYARYLVAIPIMLAAEAYVHQQLRNSIKKFLDRNIIVGEDIPKFNSAIASANRLRDSAALEAALFVLVYTLGIWVWRSQIALGAPSWYATPDGTNMNLTLAGYWLAFVSIPLGQFILVRWYVRFFIWSRFLWQISKIKLNLLPTHPDRAGGLGFLGKATYSFGPILFGQGALLSGLIANEVMHDGRDLMGFKLRAASFIIFFIAAVLAPLTVFIPVLLKTKRQGLGIYGSLASRYVRDFDKKWIDGINPEGENLLGTGDIQSLADLGNSYSVIQEMRATPFGIKDMLRLGIATALPLLPLSLFVYSVEDLLEKLVKILIG